MNDYRPIACALHDEYELAIMHKKVVTLEWRDEQGREHRRRVLPLDIRVRDGAEYLLAKTLDKKEELCIRLDRIKAF